ncbi:MAG: MipA/OmpV family protein [Parvularculaceae bacterium]|nr:MipA/OmpV family protein [Parvularculaceae bacterium]
MFFSPRAAAPACAAALSLISAAFAQSRSSYDDFLSFGVVSVPEYDGSADEQIVPLIFGQMRFGGARYVAIEGTGVRINVVDDQNWSLGPSVNIGFGRNDDVDNDIIALLEEIDTAIELGGFVSHAWTGIGHPSGVFSLGMGASRDIAGAHDGWQANLTAGYGRNMGDRLRVDGTVGLAVMGENIADTYFSVSSADALASGLGPYEAASGVRDYNASLAVIYQLSDRWSAVGYTSYRRLTGDAADSPIVDQEGDPNQIIAAFGLGYAF